ncbi:hypothetical protein ACN09C_26595 (plasmid) [Serratia fonticola]|uniref:hypothetical protein n=1 Tax=Serratia fonticola TaxID=47917 RepID=UPI003AFF6EE5
MKKLTLFYTLKIMGTLSLLLFSCIAVPVMAADDGTAERGQAELLHSMKEAVLSGTCSGLDG